MTPIFLITELAKALREVVKDFEFVAELQPAKPVTVYEQYLPSDRFQVDSFYPLVIVSLDSVVKTAFKVGGICLTLRSAFANFWTQHRFWQKNFRCTKKVPSRRRKLSLFHFSTALLWWNMF